MDIFQEAAAAREVLVAAARLSASWRLLGSLITCKDLEGRRLTEEEVQLAARVIAWTVQLRLVALTVLRPLRDEPLGERAAPPLTDPGGPP